MADYYTLLTTAGLAYETACKANGLPIKLSKMSIGDGNGVAYNPDAAAVALKREVWRGDINALLQDSNNPTWLIAELNIPDDVGGWTVREAGIWTDTGILYAVIKYPESYKPVLADSGAGKEFYIRAIFQTSNAANVTLVVDESVVKATRTWVVDYVAAELNKLDFKKSVRVVATTPITLSGAQQIDTTAVVAGDRVLTVAQPNAKDNCIWIAANNGWQRALDADTSAEVTPGLIVAVEEGAVYGDTIWQLVTNGPIVLGTTALAFEMIAGKTGIGAGTYRSLTVDKLGRVIGGSNPTTLAGYGITDAVVKGEVYSKSEVLALFPFRGRALITGAGVSNWAVPAGVTKAWVRVIGGGGGAGRYEGGGGGGGGGGVAEKLVDLTGVASVTLTIGDGGLGRTGSSGDAASGGASSFGTYCSATGGGGGSKWYAGVGGFGSGGDINTSLGNGAHQTRQDNSATNTSIYGGGHGGGPGGAGSGSGAKSSPGSNATLPGGGGGGGNENGNGGNGAPGSIEIRW